MSQPRNPSSPPRAPCILLLEDDAGVRRSLHMLLQGSGFEVRSHASASQLLADPEIARAEFFVADYRLLDGDGVEVLHALHEAGWQGRAVMITAFATPQLVSAAKAAGYVALLEKPVLGHDLVNALKGSLE